MLTVRIKNRATIGNLQGPYEASIGNRGTWLAYSYDLDRIVKYFGPDKSPDDVFTQDVTNFRAYLTEHHNYSKNRIERIITIASGYWTWMIDFGFATVNPFRPPRPSKRAQREVNVIIT